LAISLKLSLDLDAEKREWNTLETLVIIEPKKLDFGVVGTEVEGVEVEITGGSGKFDLSAKNSSGL
jgi:hypothetical protein